MQRGRPIAPLAKQVRQAGQRPLGQAPEEHVRGAGRGRHAAQDLELGVRRPVAENRAQRGRARRFAPALEQRRQEDVLEAEARIPRRVGEALEDHDVQVARRDRAQVDLRQRGDRRLEADIGAQLLDRMGPVGVSDEMGVGGIEMPEDRERPPLDRCCLDRGMGETGCCGDADHE
jgi:hypothetical protein